VTFDTRTVYTKFGAYQLKRLEPILQGIAPSTTLPIFDQSEVGYLPFTAPSLEEQQAIVSFLDGAMTKIDAMIAKIREGIEKLKEYRTALISAAVTGKIDVQEDVVG
jgi:type I restriction enzyme, S subunit